MKCWLLALTQAFWLKLSFCVGSSFCKLFVFVFVFELVFIFRSSLYFSGICIWTCFVFESSLYCIGICIWACFALGKPSSHTESLGQKIWNWTKEAKSKKGRARLNLLEVLFFVLLRDHFHIWVYIRVKWWFSSEGHIKYKIFCKIAVLTSSMIKNLISKFIFVIFVSSMILTPYQTSDISWAVWSKADRSKTPSVLWSTTDLPSSKTW